MHELISGELDLLVISWPSAIPQIRARKAKGLGITALKRSAEIPEVPTFAEAGVPGYEALQWYAVLGPAGMPPDIVQKVNAQVVRSVRAPRFAELIAKMGADAQTSTAAEFRTFLRSEVAKWSKIARQVGMGNS